MWVVPTVGEILALQEPDAALEAGAHAVKQWQVAIATLPQLLSHSISQDDDVCPIQGFILSGPVPMVPPSVYLGNLASLAFTAENTKRFQLPPGHPSETAVAEADASIPLLAADPMSAEQFCLVQTSAFSWLAVLRQQADGPQFQFSFNPKTVAAALDALRARIQLTRPQQEMAFDALVAQFPVCAPGADILTRFSRQLLQIAVQAPERQSVSLTVKDDVEQTPEEDQDLERFGLDVELLQAIAHEVRTPLTTIQTFTRLLLKRSDLPSEVLKRLEAIQRECREQIDRFSLIFRAMEMSSTESTPMPATLQPVSLQQVLEENLGRWQKQAARRDLSLSLRVPQRLPSVVISDAMMLDQVLTGLIDRLSHSLPSGSEIELQVALAGEQLKLELRSQPCPTSTSKSAATLKSVGHVLMVQPETGGLSLSLPVTKNLFQALGGKLSVRQHQQQGEVLTIFLPLGPEGHAY